VEARADFDSKKRALFASLGELRSVAVAFSGGVDSGVLLHAAREVLGDRASAVIADSASLPRRELAEAQAFARRIGARLQVARTDELDNPAYRANSGDRCYHCKTELFVQVEKLSKRLGVAVVADGSNRDDHGEHRAGLLAAKEQQVRSPLAECGFTKPEIRQLAASWELPTWDKPATPCLSSRTAYGETVTPERLAMVDAAERFLREQGFQPLRVRYHKGDMARIEVAPEMLGRFLDEGLRREVVEQLGAIGFQYVSLDLEGFRSGSLNTVLPAESLQVLGDGE